MALNTEAIAAEWKSLEQYLNERFQTNEAFRWITRQTGGKLLPAHVCLSAAVILLLMITFNLGGALLTTLILTLYPAFESLRSVNSFVLNPKKVTMWMTYWSLFASFAVLEQIADMGLILSFYYLAKLVFLVWCFLPSTEGGVVVYERVVKPYILNTAQVAPAAPRKVD